MTIYQILGKTAAGHATVIHIPAHDASSALIAAARLLTNPRVIA